jgi:broad specificity polyphosphatase/5'/3'-nucleotidase SurE
VKTVTVGSKLDQAIAGVQSAAASMKMFALDTQDQQASQTFQQLAQTLDAAVQTLQQRKQYIEQQEPQFRPQ